MLKRMAVFAVFVILLRSVAFAGDTEPVPPIPAIDNVYITCDRWPDCTTLERFGRDAIRLENATTDQEKAIAIFRWVRRVTFRGTPPILLMRLSGYDQGLATMNIYGYTYCDGNAYLCYMTWRCLGKPGHKVFVPKYGHTQAHLWWVDPDGVGRFHWFDASKGTYLYVRDGSRLASADDLWRDPSLHVRPSKTPVPSCDRQDTRGWIRCFSWSAEPLRDQRWPGLSLTDGQAYVEQWADIGKFIDHHNTMHDDVAWEQGKREFGAYEPRSANSIHTFRAAGSAQLTASSATPPLNFKASRVAGKDVLTPDRDDEPARLTWLVQTRGGIVESRAEIELAPSGTEPGTADFAISLDGGRTWAEVHHETVSKDGTLLLDLAKPGAQDGWRARRPKGSAWAGTGYLLRVDMKAAAIASVAINTLVQQNKFALPQLVAGTNRIRVQEGRIAPGRALQITYIWDDQEAQGRRSVVHVEELPFEYTIVASSDDVRQVRCREIRSEVVAATGTGNRIVEAPRATLKELKWNYPPMDRQVGVDPAPALKTEDEYVAELKSPDLRTRLDAARMLAAIATPKSFDALVEALKDVGMLEDEEGAKSGTVRSWAMAALAHTRDSRAVPVLVSYLNKGNKWDQWAAVYALALLGDRRATKPLMEKYRSETEVYTQWTVLLGLGILGDRDALPLLRHAVGNSNLDIAYAAAAGLLAMPDEASVGPLLQRGLKRDGGIPLIYACRLIGTLKSRDRYDAMVSCLNFALEEEVRGYAAWALEQIGNPAALPALKERLAVERSEWVREKLRAAIAGLEKERE